MKFLLFIPLVLLTGCATRNGYTIFLKEDESTLYNLKGQECSESGYQLDEQGKRLITHYSNCEIEKYRLLKEFEPQQWEPRPDEKEKRNADPALP